MANERDVLFGVLSAQLGLISPAQIAQARQTVEHGGADSLPTALVGAGDLTPQQHRMVAAMAREALDAHNGNARAALNDFGGDGAVMHTFAGAVQVSGTGTVTSQTPEESGFITQEHPGRYTYPTHVVDPELGRGAIGRVCMAVLCWQGGAGWGRTCRWRRGGCNASRTHVDLGIGRCMHALSLQHDLQCATSTHV